MAFTPSKIKTASIEEYYNENTNLMTDDDFNEDQTNISSKSVEHQQELENDELDSNITLQSELVIKPLNKFKLSKNLEDIIDKVSEYFKYSEEKIEQIKDDVARSPFTLGQYYSNLYRDKILNNKNGNDLETMKQKLSTLQKQYPDHYVFIIEKDFKLTFGKVIKKDHPELEIYDGNHIKVVNYLDTPFEKPSELFGE